VIDDMEIEYLNLRSPEASVDHDHEGENIIESPVIASEIHEDIAHEVQSFEIPVNQEVFAIITSETQDVTAHEVHSFEIPLNQEVFAIIPSETQDITAHGVQSIEMPVNEEIVATIACGTQDITAREVQSIEMPVNEDVVAIIASDTQDITAHEVQSIKIHVGENVAAMVASETQGLSLQEVQSMPVDGKVAAIAASETHEITALEVQSIEMPANEKVLATLANEVQCHTAPAIAIEESSTFLVKESTEQFDNKPESVQEETGKTYGKSSTHCMKWWEIYDDEVTPAVQKPDSSVLAEIYSELQSKVLAQSVGVETGNKN
jgi:molybdopterin-binding protein